MKVIFKYGKCVFTWPNIENADDMIEMMNNEKTQSGNDINKDEIIKWINEHQNDNIFSAYDCNTLEYIGNCNFNEINENKGEIGIIIRKSMQGKHYAKDMINGLIEYGFNVLGLDEIYSIVYSDNIRSINCMIQLGFEEYNRDKNVIQKDGNEIDYIYFGKKSR